MPLPAAPTPTGVPQFHTPELKNADSRPGPTGVPQFQGPELRNAGSGRRQLAFLFRAIPVKERQNQRAAAFGGLR